mmetsp:Transcript_85468/g.227904  ORF Transcript_85468/g.227904 Transcript_85468/m.227904 type:complete len:107 (+) Transcript_85468:1703-2023(+)
MQMTIPSLGPLILQGLRQSILDWLISWCKRNSRDQSLEVIQVQHRSHHRPLLLQAAENPDVGGEARITSPGTNSSDTNRGRFAMGATSGGPRPDLTSNIDQFVVDV